MGGDAREWGGASQPASTIARQDVASPTARGSQAYLAVLEHAEKKSARREHEEDKPQEEEEEKPEEEEKEVGEPREWGCWW